jgi:hypothetical protein
VFGGTDRDNTDYTQQFDFIFDGSIGTACTLFLAIGFTKKDKCAEGGPEASLRKTQWGSLSSSLLCSSGEHVRVQDKRTAELTRPDVEAQLN